MEDLAGKTVIITGASAGIGAACAKAFASRGANLVLVARQEDKLKLFSEQMMKQTKVLGISMDVADMDACESVLNQAENAFGTVNMLVNNAGMHERGDLEGIDASAVAQMVDVNMRAPLFLSAAVIPYMRRAGGGAIVMVGSLAGLAPLQGAATYSATKAGLRAFTYALADEMRGSAINVGVVSPGPVDTGFIMENIDDVEDIVFSQPMSTAEDVAEAVMTLISGNRSEIAMPYISGKLATISYNFPAIRRLLRPTLYAMGRKNKRKYKHS